MRTVASAHSSRVSRSRAGATARSSRKGSFTNLQRYVVSRCRRIAPSQQRHAPNCTMRLGVMQATSRLPISSTGSPTVPNARAHRRAVAELSSESLALSLRPLGYLTTKQPEEPLVVWAEESLEQLLGRCLDRVPADAITALLLILVALAWGHAGREPPLVTRRVEMRARSPRLAAARLLIRSQPASWSR